MPIADSTARAQKRATAVRIPKGLAEMSNMEAALAYAKAGAHVLPARGKKPGGYVGAGWQEKSSRDPDQIKRWWEQWPEANIAAHLGPSGLIAFDRDKVANLSALPEPYRSQLGRARFQETRPDGSRGHYLFRVRKSDRFSNSPGGFSAFGDVRGANGVIILEPSTHTDGGRYHWPESGSIPTLPDDLRALLTAALEHEPALPNADLEAFLDTYTKADRPAALQGPLAWFQKEIADGGGRHQSLLEAASWAFREVFAGCYPARTAHDALAKAWEAAFLPSDAHRADAEPSDRCPGQDELTGIAAWAAAQALTSDPSVTLARLERDKSSDERRPILKFMSAAELAEPVPPIEFLISSALARDTFGPNAGPKKSLKTHNNQAMGFAVASGLDLFGCDQFKVPRPMPVLCIIGEGGELPYRRLLQRVARAYGVDLADIPLTVAFGAAPLGTPQLTDEIKRGLDVVQPGLVILESFYNFHPADIEAGNLYSRGPRIAEYHNLIRGELAGATSLLTDHFRTTNNKSLDLDTIAMAGQAESADSWILQNHREAPDVGAGEFRLLTAFESRQWGGTRWEVDWHCGPFDTALGQHIGEITWDVRPADATTAASDRKGIIGHNDLQTLICEYVGGNPDEKESTIVAHIAGVHHVGDKRVKAAFLDLAKQNLLSKQPGKVQEGGREVTRPVWRLGNARVRLEPRRAAEPGSDDPS